MQNYFKLCAGWMLVALLLAAPASGTQVMGSTAGDGDDTSLATFHFNADNADFHMTRPDGTPLELLNMTFEYGKSIQIYENNVDYIQKLNLKVIGANLSGANWTNAAYPDKNTVALDPFTGRIKFSVLSAWQPAVAIDNNNGLGFGSTVGGIACNDSNQAFSVWDQSDGSNTRVYTNRFIPGTGWYGAVTIDAGAGNNASTPQVAVNSQGQAICVFTQGTTNATRVYATRYTPSTGWYTPVTIDTGATATYTLPNVAINTNGQAFCVFSRVDADGSTNVCSNRYEPASGWFTAVTINATGNSLSSYSPSLALDDAGNAYCAFLQLMNDGNWAVYMNRFVARQGWVGTSGRVDNATLYNSSSPIALANNAGRVMCVFEQGNGIRERIYANEFSGTTWGTPTAVDNEFSGTASLPSAAMNSSGQVVCAYQKINGVNNIMANHFVPGTGWYAAVTIDANVGLHALNPRVVMNDNGQALCIYLLQTAQPQEWATDYIPGAAGWQKSKMISRENEMAITPQNYPVVSLNNTGKGFAMFRQTTVVGPQRMFVAEYANAVPVSELKVDYNYMLPTPTPTSSVPGQSSVQINKRKIEPRLGEQVNIQFGLRTAGLVSIKLYNLQGELVKVLVDQYYAAGVYACAWAGENLSGALVASGVYIVHIKTPDVTKTQKVVVIK